MVLVVVHFVTELFQPVVLAIFRNGSVEHIFDLKDRLHRAKRARRPSPLNTGNLIVARFFSGKSLAIFLGEQSQSFAA